MKYCYAAIILLYFLSYKLLAQDVHVGIEPFPPLIEENGQGDIISMLTAIEKISDLKFFFHVMNYARAKKELEKQKLDLIGLTPQGYESPEFYYYATDIKWSVDAKVDLYALDKLALNTNNISDHSIGTLRGNADFFSMLLNIPRNKFVEVSSLFQLIKMLEKKRLDVITFERASTMSTLNELKIPHVFYKRVAKIPASFAVNKTTKGLALKKKIDLLLRNINTNQYFKAYQYYQALPDTGKVMPNRSKPLQDLVTY